MPKPTPAQLWRRWRARRAAGVVACGTDSSGRTIYMTRYMRRWHKLLLQRLTFTPTVVQGAWMTRNGGGATASAGVHDAGGCLDFRTWDLELAERQRLIREIRRSGAAAWYRDETHGGFDPHIHIVLGSDPGINAAAYWQWTEYLAGRDGLASRGADYHYRPDPIVTMPPKGYI